MSWMNDLYLTYEACKSEVGIVKDGQPVLLPIAHSTQNAQIEIVLNENSTIVRVLRIEKKDAVTVIPVTEDSGCRAGSVVYPHPLADKLEYLAGDYVDYVSDCKQDKFPAYIEQLNKWADSPFTLPQIVCVRDYLQRRSIINDLQNAGLLSCEEGKIAGEKQQGVSPEDWFVRFSVEIPDCPESRLYCNHDVFESYIEFYLKNQNMNNLCYVLGKIVPCSEKHPYKIRNTADKAKLISSNDASGIFTYKGRFQKSSQAAMVSYEISQKAHNALRWLIAKQACMRIGEQVVVVWSMDNPKLENVFAEFSVEMSSQKAYTNEEFSTQVKKSIWGTTNLPKKNESVIVMCVEAATTGRLSIPFYQKYEAPVFLDRIASWKTGVRWTNIVGKEKLICQWSPSLMDIAKLVVGDKSEKLNKYMRERLLPCIIEGRKLPYDVLSMAVQKCINPQHFDKYYEWENSIDIACALINKYMIENNGKEEIELVLDNVHHSRSFIFGQLLATAEMIERKAYFTGNGKGIDRNTAVEKYFVRFQRYPVQTWEIIRNQLQPYIMRLTASGKVYYIEQLDKYTASLDMNDKYKLEPTFLQGYSSQLMEYRNYQKQIKRENEEEE